MTMPLAEQVQGCCAVVAAAVVVVAAPAAVAPAVAAYYYEEGWWDQVALKDMVQFITVKTIVSCAICVHCPC